MKKDIPVMWITHSRERHRDRQRYAVYFREREICLVLSNIFTKKRKRETE